MLKKYIRPLFLVTLLFSQTLMAQDQFGRYLGVLKNARLGQDQLAKLDFVVSRQNATEMKLIALLSLYFGDYESQEYITYHFDSVRYNIVTGALVFDQADQEITLVVDRFGAGQFEGRLRAVSAGDVGVLSMSRHASVETTQPLIQPLWGEYRGICDGVGTVLQVQTHRSNNDSSRMGDPFGTYDVTAQLAEVDPRGCLAGSSLCVSRTYDAGSYNFFRGHLELTGLSRTLACTVGTTVLSCGGCALNRTSTEAAGIGIKRYPHKVGSYQEIERDPNTPAAYDSGTHLGGNYRGYLFHERLGTYQPVSLNVVTYQGSGQAGNPALFISAVSSMYFGSFSSQEYVTHRFNEREYPLLAPQIVLERMDGDVDAIIQLTQLGNGRARGVWYSMLYGRIGVFELSNTDVPKLPEGAVVMDEITGKYNGAGWSLDLQVVRESAPINTVNPFYPLNFKGAFRFQDITANTQILGGSFDFYTGKLSFQLDGNSLFTGYRKDNLTLMLKRPTPGTLRPLLPHRHQPFIKVSL